jgi:ribosomal protein S6--L-glutamate ligase
LSKLKYFFILIFLSSCAHLTKESADKKDAPALDIQEFKAELVQIIRSELRQEVLEEWKKDANSAFPLATEGEVADSSQVKANIIANKKIVIGRIEWVNIGADNIKLKARVDTGAKTCSMHAENIREEVINGDVYVRFDTYNEQNEKITLLRPVISQQKVKNTSGESSNRYVVREKIQLGGKHYTVNVNLNDRSRLQYNFLMGRNLLIGKYIVDVSQSFILGREK